MDNLFNHKFSNITKHYFEHQFYNDPVSLLTCSFDDKSVTETLASLREALCMSEEEKMFKAMVDGEDDINMMMSTSPEAVFNTMMDIWMRVN